MIISLLVSDFFLISEFVYQSHIPFCYTNSVYVELDNCIFTKVDDFENNDGDEGKLFVNHGYNYLVDDAYRSEFYGIVSDEDDVHEHEEKGYIPIQQSAEQFFLVYRPPYRENDKKRRKKNYDKLMKTGKPYWHSIYPEGKLYDMKTYTEIDDDV